ncbi:hypothetical protein ACVQ8P_08050 [Dellaglioa sp. BT-FLS60]
MKYTEATKILEEAGFKVEINNYSEYFTSINTGQVLQVVGSVSTAKPFIIDLNYIETPNLKEGGFILANTLTQLAMTPLVERTESTPDVVDMFEDIDSLVDHFDNDAGTIDTVNSLIVVVKKLVSANEAMHDRLVKLEKVED